MALYRSEFTKFIQKKMNKNPQWREEQLAGRALLWDKVIDQSQQHQWQQAELVRPAYPYDTNFESIEN